MFNLMTYLNSHPDKLSEEVRSEVSRIKTEHDNQMIQKGIIEQTHKEKPS